MYIHYFTSIIIILSDDNVVFDKTIFIIFFIISSFKIFSGTRISILSELIITMESNFNCAFIIFSTSVSVFIISDKLTNSCFANVIVSLS